MMSGCYDSRRVVNIKRTLRIVTLYVCCLNCPFKKIYLFYAQLFYKECCWNVALTVCEVHKLHVLTVCEVHRLHVLTVCEVHKLHVLTVCEVHKLHVGTSDFPGLALLLYKNQNSLHFVFL